MGDIFDIYSSARSLFLPKYIQMLYDLEGKDGRMHAMKETQERARDTMRFFLQDTLEISHEDLRKLYIRYKNGELKYLLTYDMGCGNTSAAITSLQGNFPTCIIGWERREGSIVVPLLSVKTILGRDSYGYLIGQDAMSFTGSVENFKAVPDDDNLEKQFIVGRKSQGTKSLWDVWMAYFQVTFNNCLRWINLRPQYGGTDVTRKNTIFVVAHPAGQEWNQELGNYRKLIMEATGLPGEQIITFSEAKASMMFARQKTDKAGRLVLRGKKETIVIDLGASTIDVLRLDARGNPVVLYVDADGNDLAELSIPLAGRNIDELLGHALLEKYYQDELGDYSIDEIPDEAFFRKHKVDIERNVSEFRFDMRDLKERVCSGFGAYQDLGTGKIILGIDGDGLRKLLQTRAFTVNCHNADFMKFMNGKNYSFSATWEQTLTKLVEYVARGASEDCQIVVTGGTANLLGVEDCVRIGAAAAGVTNPKLVILNEPADYECTVPFGSAEYMMRVLKNLEELEKFPIGLIRNLRQWICDAFTESIAPLIVNDVKSKMNNIVTVWANADGDETVQTLLNKIDEITYTEEQINVLMKKGTAVMRKQSAADVPSQETVIRNNVEEMCIKLLKSIAPAKEFNSQLDFSDLSVSFPTGTIKYSVQQSLKDVNWLGAQNWWGRLWNTDPNESLSQRNRMAIARNWQGKNIESVENKIKADVLSEVKKQFDKTSGFGIPEAVMNTLCSELSLALFQQDDTERS